MKSDSRWLFSSILAGLIVGTMLALPFFVKFASAHNARVEAPNLMSDIRQTMLISHRLWQTLSGKATITLYNGTTEQTQVVSFAIAQPEHTWLEVKVNTVPVLLWQQTPEQITWVNATNATYTAWDAETFVNIFEREMADLPENIEGSQTDTVFRHPIGSRIPSVLGDYLFPTGLAQKSVGEYTFEGTVEHLGRTTYQIAWYARTNDAILQPFPTMRYWVDKQTGVILKSMIFDSEYPDQIIEEMTMTEFNLTPSPDTLASIANFVDLSHLQFLSPEDFFNIQP